MNKTLEVLYHATFPDYAERIRQEGIAPNEEGIVHFTTSPLHSAGFIALTGGRRWKGMNTITTENNRQYSVPTFDTFKKCVIFGVPISLLTPDALTVSSEDFSSPFFPQGLECYDYGFWIPPEQIVSDVTMKLSDASIPMKP